MSRTYLCIPHALCLISISRAYAFLIPLLSAFPFFILERLCIYAITSMLSHLS